MVSEKKIFLSFSHYKSMGANDPPGVASLDPRGLIGRIYVGDHNTLLHTEYISSGPHGFRVEDFLCFSHYKPMGAIYGHGGHPDLQTTTICTYFPSSLTQGST